MDPPTHLRAGRYAVRAILGEGAQGVTYEASDTQTGRSVAIKRFDVLPVDFTEAGGELTPTLKLKRNVVLKQYSSAVDGLYH